MDEPLEHLSAELRFALDETPINPDSPILKALTMRNRVPFSIGRASMWTLLPLLRVDGSVLCTLLLKRCQSLPVDAAKFSSSHNFCIGVTENSQQTDDMGMKFAVNWLQECGTSYETPVFVCVDGNSSHVTRAFVELSVSYGLYVVVEPSHTSIILQVADLAVHRFLKDQYSRDYTSLLLSRFGSGVAVDKSNKISCLLRSIHSLQKNPAIVSNFFLVAGLLSGYKDVFSHFPSSKFVAGPALRDTNLQHITQEYERIFSVNE